MNRRPVGSSGGTSGEGFWALSCSLLANFAPSDEPTPSCLLTIGSSGAEEICLSSQTRTQLLRRVKSIGRRTIRWLVSLKSRSAPTVRPTLLFFNRQFIRRYTGAWVLPVISVGGLSIRIKPYSVRRRARAVRRRPARLCRPSRERARLCLLHRPLRARRASPPCSIARAPPPPPHPIARVWAAPRFPVVRCRGCSPASQRRSARLKSSSTAIHHRPFLRCGEDFTDFPPFHCTVLGRLCTVPLKIELLISAQLIN
jgi:hypothetical protein